MFTRRPWGWFLKFVHWDNFWLKLLWVPGRTSLQKHLLRDEWHIGIYKVKQGEVHRLQHGVFIELGFGLPREQDVIRLEDDYGR